MLRTDRPPLMNGCRSGLSSWDAMYFAGLSRSPFLGEVARASTCARRRAASSRSSGVNSSGPEYELPGMAIMYATAPAASAARPTTTARRALIERVLQLGDQVL